MVIQRKTLVFVYRWSILWVVLLTNTSPAAAQGTKSDYERVANLRRLTENKIFRNQVQPNWLSDGKRFWYRVRTGPDRHEFVLVDAEKGTRQPAFDHQRLAAALSQAAGKEARPERLGIDGLEFPAGDRFFDFHSQGKWWRCQLPSYTLKERPGTEKSSGTAGIPGVEQLRPVPGGPQASRRIGAETTITFCNRTQGVVEVFWLDSQGERQSYGKLRAGEERPQHTYAGHVWLFVDGQNRPLGIYQAGEKALTVEIRSRPSNRPPALPDALSQEVSPLTVSNQKPSRDPWRSGGGTSPDGRWTAFIKQHNVWVKKADGQELALSTEGTAEDAYRGGFYWSPDSQKLVVFRRKPGEERKINYLESSPSDQVQPKLHSLTYAKPGDRIPVDKPHLFDVPARRPIPVSDGLFANPWSVGDLRWAQDSSRFTFVFNQRGHQVLRLLAVNARTGTVEPIIDERSSTFIDYSGKYYLHYLDVTGELIWMSERDGWNHLYLYDARSGKVKNQITRGEWVVRGVDRVDAQQRQIWFRAGGIRPGQDPYYIHFGCINFDGTGLTILTEGDGTHTIEYSPDRRFLLDSYSRVDLPPVTELRRTEDGKLVCVLEQADWSALRQTGWQAPERFKAKGRDGTTDIFGVLYRPMHFDPKKKHPIIEDIYAGPQGSFVPKGFRSLFRQQALAELGFIVVQIDGMGTSNRSKKFHDVCWKNLADAGFPDRILWIKAAAAKYPYLDLGRVGIMGGSAGGQNAACALMTHGDFYKVAVADCGCHDNRMDKIWWNEQWMGWPVGPHYAANSNVTLARGLQGKLFLIVGEMDTNVDPASTMQVVNALVKANKDFDMLVVPGAGHGAAEGPYASRRRTDFLVRHLLGVEPRSIP